VTDGIATPESAYFDAASGFIFVSQVEGAPDGRDGQGRVVKLNRDGSVVTTTWVTGLNAPKGLRRCGSALWVADLGEVLGIDIESGKTATRVPIPGSGMLNDVACGLDGTVYVSDTMGSRIYQIRNGQASVFAEGEELEYPNGLLVDGDRLVVGGWGKPEADFSTKVPGRLFTLDLKTKQKTLITPDPFGNIDGLESDGRGGYLVSDFNAGKVLRVTGSNGTLLGQFTAGVADIGLIPETGTLLIPHMNENRVAAYDVAAALR
jgi:sugar lactone lactonase YvrE